MRLAISGMAMLWNVVLNVHYCLKAWVQACFLISPSGKPKKLHSFAYPSNLSNQKPSSRMRMPLPSMTACLWWATESIKSCSWLWNKLKIIGYELFDMSCLHFNKKYVSMGCVDVVDQSTKIQCTLWKRALHVTINTVWFEGLQQIWTTPV